MNTSVSLDVSVLGVQTTVNATKGNYGNTYTFSFHNAGTALDLSTITAINLYIKKPDGVSVYNSCTKTGNTAIYTETEQTLIVAGNAICMLQLISNGAVVWSPKFKLCIAENVADTSSTVSTFEANALAKYVDDAEDYAEAALAAKTAIDNMDATATVTNTVGTPSVTVTKSTVSDHTRFNFAFDNIKGNTGETGATGAAAGFGTPSITVSGLPAGSSPTATVSASGADTSKIFAFNFSIPQGAKGDTGDTGAKGDTGEKGDTGDSGVYIGTTPPTNGANVWINPNGSAAYGMYDGTVTVG